MGFSWARFADIAKQLAPTICALAGVPMLGQAIGIGIGEAQQIAGATNEQKKAHVMNLAAASLAGTNAVLAAQGKPALPTDDILAAASGAIDTTVQIVKVAHDAHPTTPDIVPTPTA